MAKKNPKNKHVAKTITKQINMWPNINKIVTHLAKNYQKDKHLTKKCHDGQVYKVTDF